MQRFQCIIRQMSSSFTRPLGFETDKIRKQFGKPPTFNMQEMTNLLDHDNLEMRNRLRLFLKDDIFRPRYNIPLTQVNKEKNFKIIYSSNNY